MNPLTAGKGTEQLLSDAQWCRVVQEDERPTGAIHAARPNYLAPDVAVAQHEPVTFGAGKLDGRTVAGDVGDPAKHAARIDEPGQAADGARDALRANRGSPRGYGGPARTR
jgi:hypothetical protein